MDVDIDISDILADISRPSGHQPSHTDPYDASTAYTDHILLTRAWTTERCTPTLQTYPSALLTRILSRIRAQISRIEDLTSGAYDTTTIPVPGQPAQNQQNVNLVLSILQTDLSRTQFLVRSYLRQRLAKITKHATYYAKYHTSTDPTNDAKSNLLSPSELHFLQHHQHLLTQLYSSSFLSSLPVSLRRLDDSTGGNARMDEEPDDAVGVFVRCLAGEWSNDVEVDGNLREGDGGGGNDESGATVEIRMERGGVLVGRWRDVRAGVEGGMLEVL